MKRNKTIRVLLSIALCFFISCSEKKPLEVFNQENAFEDNALKDITSIAEALADSIFTDLTLEERIGQCLMPSISSSSDSVIVWKLHKWIQDCHIGGVVLLKGDISSAKLLSKIGTDAGIPLFIAVDAEWGLGMRFKDALIYPKNGEISSEEEETSLYDYGREIALQSKNAGINMILGPVLDISSIKHGVMGYRSFGTEPGRVADFGVAYAKGLESGGVISVAKHFPGHGSALSDSHKKIAQVSRDITTMDSIDLRPFRDYIQSGLTGIMAGHISAHALDPSGKVASASIDVLTSLLREEMNFKGLILTDALDMGGAKGLSATDALKAGADLVLCPVDLEWEYKNILKNINEGSLDISIINDRCRRILFTKSLFLIVN